MTARQMAIRVDGWVRTRQIVIWMDSKANRLTDRQTDRQTGRWIRNRKVQGVNTTVK